MSAANNMDVDKLDTTRANAGSKEETKVTEDPSTWETGRVQQWIASDERFKEFSPLFKKTKGPDLAAFDVATLIAM